MKIAMKVMEFTEMSVRARAALEAAGIHDLQEAAGMTDEELLAIEGVGESSVEKIRAWDYSRRRAWRLRNLEMEARESLATVESLARRLLIARVQQGMGTSANEARSAWDAAMEIDRCAVNQAHARAVRELAEEEES